MSQEPVEQTLSAGRTGPEPSSPDRTPAEELRERLLHEQAQARALRALSQRLAHELALTQRVLAARLPSTERRPETMVAVRLPTSDFSPEGLWFSLDECEEGPERTRVRGWAFFPGLDCREAVTTLLFQSARAAYAAAADFQLRPDLAQAFADHEFPAPPGRPENLEHAGFICELFNASLPAGDYELFLQIESPESGAAVRQSTGVRFSF